MQMAMDPTVNMNWGAPLRLPEYTLEDMFEKEAEALKASFGIESEEEWQVVNPDALPAARTGSCSQATAQISTGSCLCCKHGAHL